MTPFAGLPPGLAGGLGRPGRVPGGLAAGASLPGPEGRPGRREAALAAILVYSLGLPPRIAP